MSSSPLFSDVKAPVAKTSLFNLSFENKLTTNWFRLTPFLCKEVLPGDTFRVNTEMLVRLAPMFAPLMHRIRVYTHFFFVPYRLLWEHWEEFITQSKQGYWRQSEQDTVQTMLPTFTFPSVSIDDRDSFVYNNILRSGSLADYLGLNFSPAGLDNSVGDQTIGSTTFQYLPFLAYQKIYNDYYRDENQEEDDFMPAADGNLPLSLDNPTDLQVMALQLRYRYWKKDYFTSALPFPQKGEDITLPLGGAAPLVGTVDTSLPYQNVFVRSQGTAGGTAPEGSYGNVVYQPSTKTGSPSQNVVKGNLVVNSAGRMEQQGMEFYLRALTRSSDVEGFADLSQATPTTINELRRAFALQRWEELNARGGTRYVEQLAAHFGVRPRDSRLQRAEYLGGGVSDVTISEVLQTSASQIEGSTTPQGQMAGHGISASYNHAFKRYFDEHGVVLGILSIMPDANYYQGADRMFLKRSWSDFGWPSLANLGEQPIYPQEIYNHGIPLNVESDAGLFGYTPRYAEYKFSNDHIHGEFRTSLSNWHAGRVFGNDPQLNQDFMNGSNFSPDVFAVQDVDPFWIQIYNNIKAVRKLPKFGTPI